jgi:hypothetical protein
MLLFELCAVEITTDRVRAFFFRPSCTQFVASLYNRTPFLDAWSPSEPGFFSVLAAYGNKLLVGVLFISTLGKQLIISLVNLICLSSPAMTLPYS